MLFVTKPALLRLRKKHGHVTDQKHNGVDRKGKSHRHPNQISLRKKQKAATQHHKYIMAEYQKEAKKIQKIEVQWHGHSAYRVHVKVKQDKHRRHADPQYKALFYARKRVTEFCKLRNMTKEFSVSKMIGCTAGELRKHIESQFTSAMTWNNHGSYWEIDHIIPLASARTVEEVKTLCHWSNLQPLTVMENRIKSDKISGPFRVKSTESKLPKFENLSSKPQIWLPTLAQFAQERFLTIEPCLGEGQQSKCV